MAEGGDVNFSGMTTRAMWAKQIAGSSNIPVQSSRQSGMKSIGKIKKRAIPHRVQTALTSVEENSEKNKIPILSQVLDSCNERLFGLGGKKSKVTPPQTSNIPVHDHVDNPFSHISETRRREVDFVAATVSAEPTSRDEIAEDTTVAREPTPEVQRTRATIERRSIPSHSSRTSQGGSHTSRRSHGQGNQIPCFTDNTQHASFGTYHNFETQSPLNKHGVSENVDSINDNLAEMQLETHDHLQLKAQVDDYTTAWVYGSNFHVGPGFTNNDPATLQDSVGVDGSLNTIPCDTAAAAAKCEYVHNGTDGRACGENSKFANEQSIENINITHIDHFSHDTQTETNLNSQDAQHLNCAHDQAKIGSFSENLLSERFQHNQGDMCNEQAQSIAMEFSNIVKNDLSLDQNLQKIDSELNLYPSAANYGRGVTEPVLNIMQATPSSGNTSKTDNVSDGVPPPVPPRGLRQMQTDSAVSDGACGYSHDLCESVSAHFLNTLQSNRFNEMSQTHDDITGPDRKLQNRYDLQPDQLNFIDGAHSINGERRNLIEGAHPLLAGQAVQNCEKHTRQSMFEMAVNTSTPGKIQNDDCYVGDYDHDNITQVPPFGNKFDGSIQSTHSQNIEPVVMTRSGENSIQEIMVVPHDNEDTSHSVHSQQYIPQENALASTNSMHSLHSNDTHELVENSIHSHYSRQSMIIPGKAQNLDRHSIQSLHSRHSVSKSEHLQDSIQSQHSVGSHNSQQSTHSQNSIHSSRHSRYSGNLAHSIPRQRSMSPHPSVPARTISRHSSLHSLHSTNPVTLQNCNNEIHSFPSQHSIHSISSHYSIPSQHFNRSQNFGTPQQFNLTQGSLHSIPVQHSNQTQGSVHSIPSRHSDPVRGSVHSIPSQHSDPPRGSVHSILSHHSNPAIGSVHSIPSQYSDPPRGSVHSILSQHSNPSQGSIHSIPSRHSNPSHRSVRSIVSRHSSASSGSRHSIPSHHSNPSHRSIHSIPSQHSNRSQDSVHSIVSHHSNAPQDSIHSAPSQHSNPSQGSVHSIPPQDSIHSIPSQHSNPSQGSVHSIAPQDSIHSIPSQNSNARQGSVHSAASQNSVLSDYVGSLFDSQVNTEQDLSIIYSVHERSLESQHFDSDLDARSNVPTPDYVNSRDVHVPRPDRGHRMRPLLWPPTFPFAPPPGYENINFAHNQNLSQPIAQNQQNSQPMQIIPPPPYSPQGQQPGGMSQHIMPPGAAHQLLAAVPAGGDNQPMLPPGDSLRQESLGDGGIPLNVNGTDINQVLPPGGNPNVNDNAQNGLYDCVNQNVGSNVTQGQNIGVGSQNLSAHVGQLSNLSHTSISADSQTMDSGVQNVNNGNGSNFPMQQLQSGLVNSQIPPTLPVGSQHIDMPPPSGGIGPGVPPGDGHLGTDTQVKTVYSGLDSDVPPHTNGVGRQPPGGNLLYRQPPGGSLTHTQPPSAHNPQLLAMIDNRNNNMNAHRPARPNTTMQPPGGTLPTRRPPGGNVVTLETLRKNENHMSQANSVQANGILYNGNNTCLLPSGGTVGNSMPPGGQPGNNMPPGGQPRNNMPPGGMPGNNMPPGGMPGNSMLPDGQPGNNMPPGGSLRNNMPPGGKLGRYMPSSSTITNNMPSSGTLRNNLPSSDAFGNNSQDTAILGNSMPHGATHGNHSQNATLRNSMPPSTTLGNNIPNGAIPRNTLNGSNVSQQPDLSSNPNRNLPYLNSDQLQHNSTTGNHGYLGQNRTHGLNLQSSSNGYNMQQNNIGMQQQNTVTHMQQYNKQVDRSGYINHPTQTMAANTNIMQQPTNGGNMQQPAHSGNMQQPTNGGNMQQPAHGGSMQQPTNGGNMQQPAHGGNMQQPTNSGNMQQPAHGGNMQQPTNGGNMQQPAHGGNMQQPTNGGNMQQPTYSGNMRQQTTHSNYMRQPSTSGNNMQQPANTNHGYSNNCGPPSSIPMDSSHGYQDGLWNTASQVGNNSQSQANSGSNMQQQSMMFYSNGGINTNGNTSYSGNNNSQQPNGSSNWRGGGGGQPPNSNGVGWPNGASGSGGGGPPPNFDGGNGPSWGQGPGRDGNQPNFRAQFPDRNFYFRDQPPRMKLPTFDGNKDWTAFYKEFCRHSRKYDWSIEEQLDRLQDSLIDQARDFAGALEDEKYNNFDLLVTELLNRFGRQDLPRTARLELNNMKMNDKSMSEFAAEVSKKAILAYPDPSMADLRHECEVRAFLSGYKDPEIALEVMNRNPSTLVKAQDLIIEIEANKHSIKGHNNRKVTFVDTVDNSETQPSSASSITIGDVEMVVDRCLQRHHSTNYSSPDRRPVSPRREFHSPDFRRYEGRDRERDSRRDRYERERNHEHESRHDRRSGGDQEGKYPGSPERRRSWERAPASPRKCRRCGRDHPGRDCRSASPRRQSPGRDGCFNCGSNSHFKRDCPKLKDGCHNCGSRAHFKRDCPELKDSRGRSSSRSASPSTRDRNF